MYGFRILHSWPNQKSERKQFCGHIFFVAISIYELNLEFYLLYDSFLDCICEKRIPLLSITCLLVLHDFLCFPIQTPHNLLESPKHLTHPRRPRHFKKETYEFPYEAIFLLSSIFHVLSINYNQLPPITNSKWFNLGPLDLQKLLIKK